MKTTDVIDSSMIAPCGTKYRRGALIVCLLLALVTPAACGSSARIEADELVGAELALMNPPGSGGPVTLTLDLSDPGVRDRLLSAYRSMGPYKGEPDASASLDLRLTLIFTDDRSTVLSQSRDDYSFVLLQQYAAGELKDSMYMQPKVMYEYMVELADQPGLW